MINKEISTTSDNSKDLQNLDHIILSSCLKGDAYVNLVRSELKKSYFEDKDCQLIFEKILKFYDEKLLSHEALILAFKNDSFKRVSEKKRLLNKVISLDKDILINEKKLAFYLDNYVNTYRFQRIAKNFEDFLASADPKNYEDKLLNLLSNLEVEKKNFKSEKFIKISEVISNLIKELKSDDPSTNFLKTNFPKLDSLINGFYPGELIVIAGLTSIGKTSFSLALLWNIAQNLQENQECVYCSFEMTNEQLIKRIASSELAIELSKINTKSFSDYEGQKFFYFEEYMKKNDRISFSSNSNSELKDVDDLYYEIKKKYTEKTKMVALFVDYLQLMSAKAVTVRPNRNRHEEISYITKVLKKIALEFKIPVIVLSQFSRITNKEQGKKPQIYHLKESGSIEQDADIVILLHKEEEQDLNSDDPIEVELIVGKNRNGRIGNLKLKFLKKFCKFISDENVAN